MCPWLGAEEDIFVSCFFISSFGSMNSLLIQSVEIFSQRSSLSLSLLVSSKLRFHSTPSLPAYLRSWQFQPFCLGQLMSSQRVRLLSLPYCRPILSSSLCFFVSSLCSWDSILRGAEFRFTVSSFYSPLGRFSLCLLISSLCSPLVTVLHSTFNHNDSLLHSKAPGPIRVLLCFSAPIFALIGAGEIFKRFVGLVVP